MPKRTDHTSPEAMESCPDCHEPAGPGHVCTRPGPRIGETDRSEHRAPAPTPAQHNAAFDHGYADDYARGEDIRTGLNSTSRGIR